MLRNCWLKINNSGLVELGNWQWAISNVEEVVRQIGVGEEKLILLQQKGMLIKLIKTGTKEYDEMVDLRKKVLLDPFGISHAYIDPEKEMHDFLIGAFEDKLIGCCMLTKKGNAILQLRQMVVDDAYQNKGVGAAIIAFAEAIAKENGFQKMMLHARDSAMGFYSKYGYEIVGDEFLEVGLRHFLMEKDL